MVSKMNKQTGQTMHTNKPGSGNPRSGLTGISRLIAVLGILGLGLVINSAHAAAKFDHDRTGFLLNGAHTRLNCETCHAYGIFRGTPTRCAGCHGPSGTIATTKKGPNHVQSSDSCDDCHSEFTWSNARMDHSSVTGTCLSCHNGVKATGKTPTHIASADTCGDCHMTVAWSPAGFDHSNISGNCYACHNGTTATGKPNNHITTNTICEDCHHSTRTWLPATVNHSDVIGTCFSCHNGSIATGAPATISNGDPHPTSTSCNDCHNTSAWKPATGG